MNKCIGCILKICAAILGIAVVALIVMSYLGIDPLDNVDDENDDEIDEKPVVRRITKIRRNYTELKPVD